MSQEEQHYLRITCPSNTRAQLQAYIYETATVLDNRVVSSEFGRDYNVVVTSHPSAYLARYQAGRIESGGLASGFGAQEFDSLEDAMELPEFLKNTVTNTPPLVGSLRAKTAGAGEAKCGQWVESAGAPCILSANHPSPTRHRSR